MLSMREEDEGKVSENVHKRFLDLKIQNTGNNRHDLSNFHAEASQLLEDFTEIDYPPGEPRIIERFKQILRSDDRTKLILTDMLIGKVGLKDPYTMLDTLDETYLEIYPRDVEIRKVKSLISRIVDDESDSSSESQKKKKKKKKKNFDSSKDKSQFPCFKEAREKGKCGRKNCPYSHDVKILDEHRNSKISNSSSDLKCSLCHKTGHVSKNCPNVDKGDDKPISDTPKIPTKVALDSTLSKSQIVNLILNSSVGNEILDEAGFRIAQEGVNAKIVTVDNDSTHVNISIVHDNDDGDSNVNDYYDLDDPIVDNPIVDEFIKLVLLKFTLSPEFKYQLVDASLESE